VPRCNLDVSPNHAIFIDDVLVPARKLVNGVTIYQREAVDSVEYFHLELEAHDVIFAEGASAETYADCDNRGTFHNADEFGHLYPNDDPPKWTFCAPLIESGDVLQKIRRKLDDRVESFGCTTTFDPALCLLADGREIPPDVVDGCIYRFELTEQPTELRIMSRSGIPAEIKPPFEDSRRLGINLSRLVLKGGHITVTVEHQHPWLIDGFHEAEAAHRWTDGNACIPPAFFACFTQGLTVEVQVLDHTMPYRIGPRPALESEETNTFKAAGRPPRQFVSDVTRACGSVARL
jgi:Hint domain